ncbi:acyltransferase [Pseudomonas sp. NPDC089408]|uniref:acyltransferase n=1 Tax=Pseudomonas sp. NPDC089408 TaxID=3364465 RepID=UPI0038202172
MKPNKVVLNSIKPYKDANNNEIICEEEVPECKVIFVGSNNKLTVNKGTKIQGSIFFDCDNGNCNIGKNRFKGTIRVGQDCTVNIGNFVTCTNVCLLTTAEGITVSIGDDCMLASEIQIRADDGHPIFDVHTGKRVNMPKSVSIGPHVWIGGRVTILTGARIGEGSVIGYASVVKGKIPNNCVAAGVPAKVMRKDIAWERPHLSHVEPFYKPDASFVKKSKYWNLTIEEPVIS